MEYFHFTYAVDTPETGSVFEQAIFKNPKKLEPNPVLLANKANQGKFPPDDLLPFDYFVLERGAKLTDLMSSSLDSNGFFMNGKLRTIFEKFNLGAHKFYDVKLYNKDKEIKDYYYFHSASNMREYIDYPKSLFSACRLTRHVYDLPKYNSWEELNVINKTLPDGLDVRAKQLYLKSNFPFSLDFFKLYAFNYDFFISSDFKEIIEAEGMTGVKITPVNDFIKTPNLA